MKKAFFLGIAGSFFFAFTFVLNRSMHLAGGSWIWSASLRYLFAFPIMALIAGKQNGLRHIHRVIGKDLTKWLIWSTVGFGLFYAPLSFAGNFGESWLIAASWQLTIVMGVLLSPLFHKRVPLKNLFASGIILIGVFLLQTQNMGSLNGRVMAMTLVPIVIAAISYPLGNRKMMEVSGEQLTTIERTYGMMLCSLPFWGVLSVIGLVKVGAPSGGQAMQALFVALFSGVAATLLFFKATDMVKSNNRQLAVIESTQSGEVIFTLLGGVLFLGDKLPDWIGAAGIILIVVGMVLNSLLSAAGEELSPSGESVEQGVEQGVEPRAVNCAGR